MFFIKRIYWCYVLFSVVTQLTTARNVTILCVFDKDVSIDCQDALLKVWRDTTASSNISLRSVTLRSSSDIRTLITRLDSAIHPAIPDVFLTIGNSYTTKTTAMFAYCNGVPLVSLTKDTLATELRSQNVLYIGPNGKELAQILFFFIKSQNTSDVSVLYDLQTENDDFVLSMRNFAANSKTLERFKIFGTSLSCDEDKHFVRKLIELRDNGSRLIILHAGPEMTKVILRCSVNLELFSGGHIWISTNQHFPDSDGLQDVPVGILSLKYLPSTGFVSEVKNGLGSILSNIDVLADRQQRQSNGSSIINCQPDMSDFVGSLEFLSGVEREWHTPQITYSLQNLIQNGDTKVWRTVGVAHVDKIVVDTIVWPGGLIHGGLAATRKFLRVATVPAPPFVQVRDSDCGKQECFTDTPCLELNKTDDVTKYLEAFIHNGPREDQHYVFRCCSGLSIDILNRLSKDLDFEFLLYMFPQNVNRIGKLVNGTWDGVIGQVYYGVADFMIGAFSITSSRSHWIDFTSPFYQSGFTMLSYAEGRTPEMDAFLQPFSISVWLGIIAMASATAVVSSLLEWKSPYGLNPGGRNREKHYTLGSSLVMVYSVIFGHTFATKSPKSWPCRFVLNIWSIFAIVFIAYYTANLAAFLAGKDGKALYRNPEDPRLKNKQLAVIGETSIAGFMKQMYPEVYARTIKSDIRNTTGMIKQMREGKFDIFVHDLPILDYARARRDGTCKLRLVGKKFGDDGYGIGVPKGSEWKEPMSELVLSYGLSGFLEELERKHFSKLTCSTNGITRDDIVYGLPHTGGLFIMLIVGIGLSVILLMLEHCFFRFCLPAMRNKPENSIFKNIHAMFISQRLFKCTVAAEVSRSSAGAREVISHVKNKQFVQLFQKQHRQAHRPVYYRQGLKPIPQHGPKNRTDFSRVVAETRTQLTTQLTTHADVYTPPVQLPGPSRTLNKETNSKYAVVNTDLVHDEYETLSVCSSLFSQNPPDKMDGDDWPTNWENEWLDMTPSEEESSDVVSCFEDSGIDNLGFTMNNERNDSDSLVKRNISLKESDLLRNSHSELDDGNFVRSYSWRPSNDIWTVSERNAKFKHSLQEQTKSKDSVYGQKPGMKDNRTKSRIRRNTLEQLCKTFSVDLIDPFTLESLSKSELLVLWKASEINLKRQLGEMTRQRESLLTIVNSDGKNNSTDSTAIAPP